MSEKILKLAQKLGFNLSDKQAEILSTPQLEMFWSLISMLIHPIDYEIIKDEIKSMESMLKLESQKQALKLRCEALLDEMEFLNVKDASVMAKRYGLHKLHNEMQGLQSKLRLVEECIVDYVYLTAFTKQDLNSDAFDLLEIEIERIEQLNDTLVDSLPKIHQAFQGKFVKDCKECHVLLTLENKRVSTKIPNFEDSSQNIQDSIHDKAFMDVDTYLNNEKSRLSQSHSNISPNELEFAEMRSRILNDSKILESKVLQAMQYQISLNKLINEVFHINSIIFWFKNWKKVH